MIYVYPPDSENSDFTTHDYDSVDSWATWREKVA